MADAVVDAEASLGMPMAPSAPGPDAGGAPMQSSAESDAEAGLDLGGDAEGGVPVEPDDAAPIPGQVSTEGTSAANTQATPDAPAPPATPASVEAAVHPVNALVVQSALTTPRARVLCGGKEWHGVVSFHVVSNNFLGADTWSLSLAVGLDAERDLAWWSDQVDMQVSIEVAVDAVGGTPAWKQLITGVLDEYDLDFEAFTVQAQGRDMSARLIDTEIVESFPNSRASELATRFASEHGLKAEVVDSPASAGANYDGQASAMTASSFSQAVSQWDFLAHHAQREGYDLWVEGDTLHYKPRVQPDRSNVWVVKYSPGTSTPGGANTSTRGITTVNATRLRAKKRAYLAKDMMVTVASHNTATGETVRERARGNHISGTRGGAGQAAVDAQGIAYEQSGPVVRGGTVDAQGIAYEGGTPAQPGLRAPDRQDGRVLRYTFNVPNLSRAQAVALAQSKLHELTSHERTATFSMPGEPLLTPRMMVKLDGTGGSFDQLYYVSSIEREYGLDVGFEQTVNVRNSSPRDLPGTSEDDQNLVDGFAPNGAATGAAATPGGNTAGTNNLNIAAPRGSAAQQQARAARLAGVPAGSAALTPGSIPLTATPAEVKAAVRQQAIAEGVDPDFAERIVQQESGGHLLKNGQYIEGPPTRYGRAIGPMQLLDSTAKEMGVNPRDPASAIIGGVRYLGQQQDRFGNNQTAIAAAYNWGPGSASAWIRNGANPGALPSETAGYVRNTAR